jgi:hypothetical protein
MTGTDENTNDAGHGLTDPARLLIRDAPERHRRAVFGNLNPTTASWIQKLRRQPALVAELDETLWKNVYAAATDELRLEIATQLISNISTAVKALDGDLTNTLPSYLSTTAHHIPDELMSRYLVAVIQQIGIRELVQAATGVASSTPGSPTRWHLEWNVIGHLTEMHMHGNLNHRELDQTTLVKILVRAHEGYETIPTEFLLQHIWNGDLDDIHLCALLGKLSTHRTTPEFDRGVTSLHPDSSRLSDEITVYSVVKNLYTENELATVVGAMPDTLINRIMRECSHEKVVNLYPHLPAHWRTTSPPRVQYTEHPDAWVEHIRRCEPQTLHRLLQDDLPAGSTPAVIAAIDDYDHDRQVQLQRAYILEQGKRAAFTELKNRDIARHVAVNCGDAGVVLADEGEMGTYGRWHLYLKLEGEDVAWEALAALLPTWRTSVAKLAGTSSRIWRTRT